MDSSNSALDELRAANAELRRVLQASAERTAARASARALASASAARPHRRPPPLPELSYATASRLAGTTASPTAASMADAASPLRVHMALRDAAEEAHSRLMASFRDPGIGGSGAVAMSSPWRSSSPSRRAQPLPPAGTPPAYYAEGGASSYFAAATAAAAAATAPPQSSLASNALSASSMSAASRAAAAAATASGATEEANAGAAATSSLSLAELSSAEAKSGAGGAASASASQRPGQLTRQVHEVVMRNSSNSRTAAAASASNAAPSAADGGSNGQNTSWRTPFPPPMQFNGTEYEGGSSSSSSGGGAATRTAPPPPTLVPVPGSPSVRAVEAPPPPPRTATSIRSVSPAPTRGVVTAPTSPTTSPSSSLSASTRTASPSRRSASPFARLAAAISRPFRSRDEQLPPPPPMSPLCMENISVKGHLLVQSLDNWSWKWMWGVVSYDGLRCYKNEAEAEADGVIPGRGIPRRFVLGPAARASQLRASLIERPSGGNAPGPDHRVICVELLGGRAAPLFACAFSAQLQQSWCDAINTCFSVSTQEHHAPAQTLRGETLQEQAVDALDDADPAENSSASVEEAPAAPPSGGATSTRDFGGDASPATFGIDKTVFLAACGNGSIDVVKSSLSAPGGRQLIFARDAHGRDGVLLAARAGSLDILNVLALEGADILGTCTNPSDGSHIALAFASRYGHAHVVEWLLQRGASPSAPGAAGMCPLHFAVLSTSRSTVDTLLRYGADVTSRDVNGNTPLALAELTWQQQVAASGVTPASASSSPVVLLLKEAEAAGARQSSSMRNTAAVMTPPRSISFAGESTRARTESMRMDYSASAPAAAPAPPSAVASSLRKSVSSPPPVIAEVVEEEEVGQAAPLPLLRSPSSTSIATVPPAWWASRKSPFFASTREGPPGMLSSAATMRALAVEFFSACEKGDANGISRLLSSQSAEDAAGIVRSRDTLGRSGLIFAVRAGHVHCLDTLFDAGADINGIDVDGRSALSYAARTSQVGSAQWLLAHGAEHSLPDASGLTPLHQTVLSRCEPIAELLLAAGADANVVDSNGLTPAALATRAASLLPVADAGSLRSLAARLAHAVGNDGGVLAAVSSRQAGDEPAGHGLPARLPGSKRTTPSSTPSPDAAGDNGDASLPHEVEAAYLHACDHGDFSALSEVLQVQTWESLPPRGRPRALMATQDSHGRAGVHFAAQAGSIPCLELLRDAGANLSATDYKGRTAIAYAARGDRVPVLTWLIKSTGASNSMQERVEALSAQDADGMTPLHHAVTTQALNTVAVLVTAGADTTARDANGLTPLELARHLLQPQVPATSDVLFLLAGGAKAPPRVAASTRKA